MSAQQWTFLAALVAAAAAMWGCVQAYRRCHKSRYKVTFAFLFATCLYLVGVYASVLLGVNVYLLKSGILTGSGMAFTLTAVAMLALAFTDKGC